MTVALGPGPRGRARAAGRRGADPPARRALPGAARASATARATSTLTTTRGAGCPSSTDPTSSRAARYYEPSDHGDEAGGRPRACPTRRADAADPATGPTMSAGDLAAVVVSVRDDRGHRRHRAWRVASLPAHARASCAATLDRRPRPRPLPLHGRAARHGVGRRRRGRAGRRPARHGRGHLGHASTAASRLGYLAFRAPVIRVVAFGRGIGRGAARRLGAGPRERAARRRSARADVQAGAVVHRRRGRPAPARRPYGFVRLRESREPPGARPAWPRRWWARPGRWATARAGPGARAAGAVRTSLRDAVAEGRDAMAEAEARIAADLDRRAAAGDTPAGRRSTPLSRLARP